jgi:hypothetical protein
MTRRQIERFFRLVSEAAREPATVILTGAAAGSLWGHVRPSLDIDFALRPRRRHRRSWTNLEEAVEQATRLTGIRANYTEDIDRWSSISLLDYRRHARPFRRFGLLRVQVMDPAYWSIGKVSRYLDPDVRDLVAVLRRRRVPLRSLVRLWARAVRRSPRSPALTQFCRQAEQFLRAYGRRVWGTAFNAERTIGEFRRALAAGHRGRLT